MKVFKTKPVLTLLIPLFIYSGVFSQNKESRHYIDAQTPEKLKQMFRYTGDSVSFLSSHRGGPEKNFPENCIATFENTLNHSWSLIEIDPRYTKDSVIVVHHDPTLQRTTTGNGRVSDFTYAELKKLYLKDTEGNVTSYRMNTLEEMLKWAKGKTILVLDKKDVPIEVRVKMIETYNAEACAIVMAYSYEEAKKCYKINPDIMMQIFINSPEKITQFEKTGVPWENVVAFVAHQLPEDLSVFEKIHQKGALCILGSSRNIDLRLVKAGKNDIPKIKSDYNDLYRKGVDIIETDIPVLMTPLVSQRLSSETFQDKYLK